MPDPNVAPSDAARAWLASEHWQESEQNYLADYDFDQDVREALDHVLVAAFCAGAAWREGT